MPVQDIVALFQAISAGLLLIGAAAFGLTLSAAGLCTMFSWMDMHVGGFVKRVFTSMLLGGAMIGSGGALGLWMASQLHVG